MIDIFMSYAHEDETRVRDLVRALEGQGWSIFWDRRIPAGKTWQSYIGQALRDAKCVIVPWSQHSVTSDWVIEEANDAKERGILVPILLDSVKPPLGFRGIQAADLTDWKPGYSSPHFDQLVQDIAGVVGGKPHRPAPEERAKGEKKKAEEPMTEGEERRKAEEERRRKEERGSEEEKLKREAEKDKRKGQEEQKKRKQKVKFASIGFAVLIVILMIGYWGIKPKPTPTPEFPPKEIPSPAEKTFGKKAEKIHPIFTPTEIRNFIGNHLRAAEKADMDTFLNDYAEEVDYYLAGVVGKDFIRKDKENYNKRWPKRTYTIIGEVQTANTSYEDEKIVQFTYNYYVQSENKSMRGIAKNSIRVKKIDNVLKIIGEKQEVVKRGSE